MNQPHSISYLLKSVIHLNDIVLQFPDLFNCLFTIRCNGKNCFLSCWVFWKFQVYLLLIPQLFPFIVHQFHVKLPPLELLLRLALIIIRDPLIKLCQERHLFSILLLWERSHIWHFPRVLFELDFLWGLAGAVGFLVRLSGKMVMLIVKL